MGFIDKYDLFLRSSPVGNWPDRLNARYEAIVGDNVNVLAGARVLDLASHDGRWSFAALEAGAQYVAGIEVRPELVEAATKNLSLLGVARERYDFTTADVFGRPDLFSKSYDVVFCLGFFYHTTRHMELLDLISRTGASTIILDTMLANQKGRLTILRSESSDHPANGLDEIGVRNGTILVGHPTPGAVNLMLEHFGYSVRRFDWAALIARMGITPDLESGHSPANPLGDYARGLRGTFVGTRR